MNGETGRLGHGLLFAALVVVLGIIGIISAQCRSERNLYRGLFLQGVLLTWVVVAAFRNQNSDLKLGGLMVVGLLILQTVWQPASTLDEPVADGDDPL